MMTFATKIALKMAAIVLCVLGPDSSAFCISPSKRLSYTALDMGKGLNKAKNKQAALAKKMDLARQQKEGVVQDDASDKSIQSLSDAEIKKRNDQLRFEQLLQQESSNVLNNYSKDGYLSKEQEEEEISAARRGVDRLFEGDPAPYDVFEGLVDIKTSNAIGTSGAKRLIPKEGEYLIVVTDPRMKSDELREAVKTLSVDLPSELRKKLIVINADSPAENRKYVGVVVLYCMAEQVYAPYSSLLYSSVDG